jgi:rare lipoprotein A
MMATGRKGLEFAVCIVLLACLFGCCTSGQMRYRGRNVIVGLASYYGAEFHGKRTSSGEVFDMYKLTAAHRDLPFGTRVLVTNLKNGRSVVVKINDRGPFVEGRIIDLSFEAARRIGMTGVEKVKLLILN